MAHRRKTGRKRGRPYNPNARRHRTDRAGRRGEVDRGSERLRSNKRLLTGREDLPLDPAGVLLGRELIDHQQYSTLSLITDWLQRAARAWGGKDGSVHGLWNTILAALTLTTGAPGQVPPGADNARYRLARALQRLDGSRDLVVALAEGRTPPLIIRAVERCLTREDEADLSRLRAGLDRLARRHR